MEYFNRLLMPFGELIEKIPLLPINKGFQRAKQTLDSIVYNMISEHRQTLQVDRKEDDLLFTLLEAQDVESGIGKMTDLQLRDEVMTIFLAGHETTSNALTWTFYLLSQHPEIEAKLDQELKTVLGNTRKLPTVDDVPKLKYTEKILMESMRLYPPAWALGRQAIKDHRMAGYSVKAGSIILMSQYVMHRNPIYFHDPNSFKPDRWSDDFRRELPRFSYFPFGGGVRSCIGEPFAWMESILIISVICKNWKLDLIPNHKVALKPLITLRPKYGMRMLLKKK
jgi:cytochrome P450